MTFVDDVLRGRAAIADFDSYQDAWQDPGEDHGEFHDFAGLLWPEYALWATDHERIDGDDVLAYVIAARRRDVGLLDHLRSVKEQDAAAAELYRLAGWWAKDWETVSQHCTED